MNRSWISPAIIAILIFWGGGFFLWMLAGGRTPSPDRDAILPVGDLAAWVGAFATFCAAAVALWVPYRQNLRELERSREARAREELERNQRRLFVAEIAYEQVFDLTAASYELILTKRYSVSFRFQQERPLSSILPLMVEFDPEVRQTFASLISRLQRINQEFERLDARRPSGQAYVVSLDNSSASLSSEDLIKISSIGRSSVALALKLATTFNLPNSNSSALEGWWKVISSVPLVNSSSNSPDRRAD